MSRTSYYISGVASVHVVRSEVVGFPGTGVMRIEIRDTGGRLHEISLHTAGHIAITGDIETPEEATHEAP